MFIPDLNGGASSTPVLSHFGRIKLGEIYKNLNNLFEFVCLHCTQVFHNYGDFTSHAHEHLTGILHLPPPAQPNAASKGHFNSENMLPKNKMDNTFEPAAIDMDGWNGTASDIVELGNDREERNANFDLNQKAIGGIGTEIKTSLAKDNFEIDDSPEAEEYSRYLANYNFRKTDGLYKCPKCKKTSYNTTHLTHHIFTHLKRQIFKCTICNKKFSSIISVQKHKSVHRRNSEKQKSKPKGKNQTTIDSVESANSQFRDLKSMLVENGIEIKDTPEAVEYFQYLCNKKMFPKCDDKFQCPKCKYSSDLANNIKRHFSAHLTDKIFTCLKCNLQFAHLPDSHKHMDFVHGIRIDKIILSVTETAAEEPESVPLLADDVQSSHQSKKTPAQNDNDVQCQICNNMVDEKYIDRHLRSHGNEKKYHCEECGDSFKEQTQLDIHTNVHMNLHDLYAKYAKTNPEM